MSTMNISSVSVNKAVHTLSALYINLIKSKQSFFRIPAVFLWGAPGIGKSEAVREIAEKMEKETGKTVNVVDVRLLLFSPIDLRGIPKADVSHRFTEWLRPKLFDLKEDENVVNILFLDELTACPASVQAAAYQITLNRCIGEHQLPENTIIIAAGNRTTDRSVAYRMPNALANRLMHLEVEVDFKSWKQWAVNHGIHPFVLGYLSYDVSKLHKEPGDSEEIAFPTPRTWTFVSDLLNACGTGPEKGFPYEIYPMVAGCIGAGTAIEFHAWCEAYRELPDLTDILQGKEVAYPKRQDVLFALISSMTGYIAEAVKFAGSDENRRISVAEIERACLFAGRFPGDFAACFYRNLMDIEGMRKILIQIPCFLAWARRNKVEMEDLND